jgi:hypothetical protein
VAQQTRDNPGENLLPWPADPPATGASAAPADRPRWDLLAERRLDPARPSGRGYQRVSDWWVSSTDPDASPMRADGRAVLGYHYHDVVDGGKARIILAVPVTPADVMENQPMRDLLWRVRFRRKLRLHHVTGDTRYGTIENIVAIEGQGIRAYAPLSDVGHRAGLFRDTDFAYDAATDTYRCPGEQTLRFLSQCDRTRRLAYEAPGAVSRACALRAQCTTSHRGQRDEAGLGPVGRGLLRVEIRGGERLRRGALVAPPRRPSTATRSV